jgi:dTDP-4-dehydrorhamnose 3,5-epimerase-like enzyme
MGKSFELIEADPSDTGNGSLLMFQSGTRGNVPFPIKKVLVVSGMKPGDVRGLHAHRRTEEIVIAVRGGCDIEMDDGTGTETVRIAGWKTSVLLHAKVWRTLRNFEPDTVLLIIADTEYDEADYIRKYEDFRAMLKESA